MSLPLRRPTQADRRPAPFQAIHVGAAAPEIPPDLVEQLAKPGRMFIPVGTTEQGEIDETPSSENQ